MQPPHAGLTYPSLHIHEVQSSVITYHFDSKEFFVSSDKK